MVDKDKEQGKQDTGTSSTGAKGAKPVETKEDKGTSTTGARHFSKEREQGVAHKSGTRKRP